jgi:hypothetical protein
VLEHPADSPLPPDYYAALASEDVAAEPRRSSALIVRDDSAIEDMPAISWLAHHVMPQGALAALYGPPGSGKSFVALDLALSVAAGLSWLGRATISGGALYLAAEGLGGLGQRVRAWKHNHGLAGTTVGVGFVTGAVNLLDASAAHRIRAAVQEVPGPLQLVVVDTLARSMIGDENDTGDMSRLIATVDHIRQSTDATVLLVHHTRKDSELERGSSALRGGVDTLILCQEGDDVRQLVCQKQKDAEAFAPIAFRLVAGQGSCAVEGLGVSTMAAPPGTSDRLTPQRLKALRTLGDDFTARGATTSEWLKASDIAERTFYRVRTWLVSEGYAAENGTRYTITPSGRYALKASGTAITATENGFTANSLPKPDLSFVQQKRESRKFGEMNGSPNGSYGSGDDGYYADLLTEIDERLGQREDE